MDDYETAALSTCQVEWGSVEEYCLYGLMSEVGEVMDLYKRSIREPSDGLEFNKQLKRELGDVLWYLTVLADSVGSSLAEVAALNTSKLAQRKAQGTIRKDKRQ